MKTKHVAQASSPASAVCTGDAVMPAAGRLAGGDACATTRRYTSALVTALLLAGCGGKEEAAMAPAAAPMAMDRAMDRAVSVEGVASPEQAQTQYLAERQFWVIELPEGDIEKRWQAHVDLCRAGCEILGAGIAKSTQSPVSAHLQLRIARAHAPGLLKSLGGPEVKERRIEREDKTLQVVDVEARLKNLAELRDRLRKLLESRPGALKDVLETERELARVQGDLDSMAAQRKALANETEKILLSLDYRPEPTLTRTGALQPLAEVFANAGHALAESLAEALMFVIRVLPWLFIVLPVVWGGWKLVKRLFAWRRAG